MTINKKKLPKYTFREEVFNSITHGIGFLFSLGILIFFIVFECANHVPFKEMYSFYIYNITMMIVFVFSTLYHTSKFDSTYRVVARIIDHSDIYLFVAGTYFPICMIGVVPFKLGLIMAIVEFALAIFGILANAIPNNVKFLKITAYIAYIIQGWLLLIFLPFGVKVASNVFWPILIGGIIYTIGAILYAIGKKKIYFHTIFHIFVVAGAATQFIGIYHLLG